MDLEALKRLQGALETVDSNIDNSKKPRVETSSNVGTASSSSSSQQLQISVDQIDVSNTITASTPTWTKYYDATSGKFYYHNIHTNKTQWEVPEDYVEPTIHTMNNLAYSMNPYTAAASFTNVNGVFAVSGGGTYWDKVNRPTDREGRQMSAFFDLNGLEQNREEAKQKKEELKKSNIDWRKYKEEKKQLKRKKRNEWLLKD